MSKVVRDIIWLPGRRVTATEILRDVAQRHGVTVEELLAAKFGRLMAPARQEAMWEIRQRTKLSFPQIARKMDLKDHTSVMHGVRRHEERLAEAREAA